MSTLPARRTPAVEPVTAPAAGSVLECAVCGLEGPLKELAECGATFHVDLSRQALGRNCGAATFGQACGFSFSCNPCIERYEEHAEGGTTGGHWRSVVR